MYIKTPMVVAVLEGHPIVQSLVAGRLRRWSRILAMDEFGTSDRLATMLVHSCSILSWNLFVLCFGG